MKLIRQLMTEKGAVSIITFNYDLGLDYALHHNSISTDYALSDINPTGMYLPYLKLHGSLHWRQCMKCQQVAPYSQFNVTVDTRKGYSIIPAIANAKYITCSKCGERVGEDPFIVPPTWNKTAYHTGIERVWKRAAFELSDAENVIVLGYSLPTTDLFFHYLFALGIDSKTLLKRFYVYDPDNTRGVEQRFQALLGSGIIKRFKYNPISFEIAVTSTPLRDVINEIIVAG